MVYNYDSKWHSNAPKTRLQLCGEDLIRSTHNFRNNDGTNDRPVLFIRHSLGGNVIQHVVHEASACIPGCNRFNLQTDHLKLNKFSGPQDRSFISVSAEISKMIIASKDLMERRKNLARESRFCVPFGRNRDFVGREPILAQLLTTIPPSLEEDDCQRTAIEGLGGVGKTQIALEAAFRVRDQYPGCSIFWVPAVDATSFENAYREIGRQLGVEGIDEDKADVKTLVKEVLSRESSGHWLLIVDNADDPDLLFSDMALSDCLPFSLEGSVLFTTRRHEVAVRLDIPQRNIVTTGEMSVAEATDLSLKGLNSRGSNLEDVKSLVVFLEKLPLAIKQASAYIAKTRMPVARYLDHCRSSDKTLIKLLTKDFEDRDVAARYLKFICFLAEKDIPISLLPPASDQLEADEAIGILKAYAFITNRESHDSFDMHRLVRLATQNWLDKEGKHEECVTEVIERLQQAFPPPQRDNKDTWIKYLPHLETALGSREGSADEAALDLLGIAGDCYSVLGQYQKSEQKALQALELQEKLLGKEHPQTLRSMNDIAVDLSLQGKHKKAEAMFRQTVELRRKVLGEDSPDTLNSMCNFGGLLTTLGKYEEAEQMLRKTLDLQVKVLDKDHPEVSYSITNLAVLLSNRGKHEEAEGLCRHALEQMGARLGEEHPQTLSCMTTLGWVLRAQEKYKEAEGVIRQTMDVREKVLGKDHPDTLTSMSDLAFVLKRQGKREYAVALMENCYRLWAQKFGPDHPRTRRSFRLLNDWKLVG
ncbi:hypothetical protein CNMCM5793_008211 [Aspergillus hiratsukae]|uniref:NB-ARC domain-containing protein n=1 Tax=Aspergillus hiratsukae TaxID=1194566 RepID=A0A8H6US12_9EURO|nr:hypothetical protein CNMCM5793_008211 [Aspergillus hiratsukae]KAF7163690.1 hypothetical protein CNMCM6106_000506 [Aspergillus hiratsukae]